MTDDIQLPVDDRPSRLGGKSDDYNPDDYETVAARVKKFRRKYPDGRQESEILRADGEPGATRWVVRASLWTSRWEDRDMTIKRIEPDAQGIAVETDGEPGVNETSALENAETSALGRALANLGLSGDKRASREEMEKARRNNGESQPRRRRKRPSRPQTTTRVAPAKEARDADA